MFNFSQSRSVCSIIYSLDDLLLFIQQLKFDTGRYAYIYHDRDFNKDGTPKSPHYHFYGYRHSPISQQTLVNFQQKCKENIFFENLKSNECAVLKYFTHDEIQDKVTYDVSEIVSNFDVQLAIDKPTSQIIDPARIVSLFDNGATTLDVVRQYPKLIYSVASLQRFERLVRQERYRSQLEKQITERLPVQPHIFTSVVVPDSEMPF